MTILLIMLLLFLAAMLAILLWPDKWYSKSVTLYYAVDKDGTACLYSEPPTRDEAEWLCSDDAFMHVVNDGLVSQLPPLTWADEPIEVTLTF